LVTTSTEQLNAVQTKLFQISQETRSSFEDNAILFNRLARSTDGLGLSFTQLLDITRGINQAIAIAGATSQEARNSLIQFSQGLAAGALRGDELRSVVEQLPTLASAIAKEFGKVGLDTARSLGVTEEALRDAQKTTGDLAGGALVAFAKANDGILKTPGIIKAIQNALVDFGRDFSKIDVTVGQAFIRFQNNLTLFIGGLSNSVKLGKQVDIVLTFIAQNLDKIAISLAALLAIGAFNLITSQVLRLGGAVRGLLGFLTAGFTSILKLFGLVFSPLIVGARVAAQGALLLTTFYASAVRVIFAQLTLLGARFGLLRLAVVNAWGGAMAFMRATAVVTSSFIVRALSVIPATFALIVGGARAATVGMLTLASVTGGASAAFTVLAGAAKASIGFLATGLVRIIPVILTVGVAVLSALLPGIVIVGALVAGFFAVRAAVQALEKTFGDLGIIFKKVVGGIFGLVDGLVESFSLLDDAIADIAITAANNLISGFEQGINGVIALLNAIPGIDITPADLSQFENEFEGAAIRVKDILARNINEGVQEGFDNTETFKTLEGVFDQIKGLLSGGLLPADFDDAKLKTLLDQISGSTEAAQEFNAEAGKAATSIRNIRASVDPAAAAFKKINNAFEAFSKINKDSFKDTEFARETLRLLAEDILNVKDAEFRYAQQLEIVTVAQEKLGLSAERAALARQQFALEARQDLDNTLSGVFPLIRAEGQLLKIETDLQRLRVNGVITTEQSAVAQQRLAREAFGLGQTVEQVNEQITALRMNQKLLGLSTSELEAEVRKLDIAFLDTQRDAGSGINRAFLKLTDDATNAAKFTEQVFTDAFKAIEDQVVSFVQTGKFSFNEFFRSVSEQLIRLGTQQAIAGLGGFGTNLLGGQGGFGGGGPSGNSIAGIGGLVTSGLGSLFGFQNGGSFTVGANTAAAAIPGIDNRLIMFRAKDGEDVSVTPRGGQVTEAPVNQIFNIQTKDADSFRRSQTQIQNRALAGINQARRRR
jgi:lambda family phage tail tape measure protein